MLYRLEIENFYSIRDPQIIDLRVGDGVPHEPERFVPIFEGSSERVPRVVALFGPNASGKSNLLRVPSFIAWFWLLSFQQESDAPFPFERFNSSESHDQPTRLAMEWGGSLDLTVHGSPTPHRVGTWRYELVIDGPRGAAGVVKEALRQRPSGKGKWVRVFERELTNDSATRVLSSSEFDLGGLGRIVETVRDTASLISTLSHIDHIPSLCLRQMAGNIGSNIIQQRSEFTDVELFALLLGSKEILSALNRDISRVDLGIRRLRTEMTPTGPIVLFEHSGMSEPMAWPSESHGTQRFIKIFPWIYHALNRGGLAVIDEIDISIHPLVLPEIVGWFHDPERNRKPHGQLLTSCHAVSLMEELRKEQVLLCEKDSSGQTRIFGLQDIHGVRRSDNHYRKYMSGIYGAVPRVG